MRAEAKHFLDGRRGPSRYFKQLRFFACEGLMVIIDERETRTNEKGEVIEEGDVRVLLPLEFKMRCRQFLRTYRDKTYAEHTPTRRSEIKLWHKQLAEGLEAVKEAQEMGDPSDPRVQEYWAKHHGKPYVSLSSLPTLDTILKVGNQVAKNVGIVSSGDMTAVSRAPITKLTQLAPITADALSMPDLAPTTPKLILPNS
jgi:hypothetical protein